MPQAAARQEIQVAVQAVQPAAVLARLQLILMVARRQLMAAAAVALVFNTLPIELAELAQMAVIQHLILLYQ